MNGVLLSTEDSYVELKATRHAVSNVEPKPSVVPVLQLVASQVRKFCFHLGYCD